uniref:Uncharacterized protein n=1 Tax=Cyanothece sp. (strain PCC 7425 / ATCC 29141) TaxID=395961 RepID=B8HN91_CYAP4
MKLKILALLVILSLGSTLAACGGGETTTTPAEESPAMSPSPSPS